MNFIDKKVSAKQIIEILESQGIHMDDQEATVILDFLYLMAKNHREIGEDEYTKTLTGIRTSKEMHQTEN